MPWHVLPRKAAETDATLKEAHGNKGPSVKLRNKGAEVGEYDVFSLTGVSSKAPRSELPARATTSPSSTSDRLGFGSCPTR